MIGSNKDKTSREKIVEKLAAIKASFYFKCSSMNVILTDGACARNRIIATSWSPNASTSRQCVLHCRKCTSWKEEQENKVDTISHADNDRHIEEVKPKARIENRPWMV